MPAPGRSGVSNTSANLMVRRSVGGLSPTVERILALSMAKPMRQHCHRGRGPQVLSMPDVKVVAMQGADAAVVRPFGVAAAELDDTGDGPSIDLVPRPPL
jgi:hypothetical protein